MCGRAHPLPPKKAAFIQVQPVANVAHEKRWENIEQAVSSGQRELSKADLYKEKGPVVICAAGPSLLSKMDKVKELAKTYPVCAIKGTDRVLIENGVIPKYAVYMDAQDNQIRFFNNPHPDVTYYISAMSPPEVFEKLKGFKVVVWHCSSRDKLKAQGKNILYITGGRSTGLRALNLMRALGHDYLHMFGYDCCDAQGVSHVYSKPKYGRKVNVWMGEREFQTTMDMVGQHTDFLHQLRVSPDVRFCLWGNGMLSHAMKEFVRHSDNPCPYYYMPYLMDAVIDDAGRILNPAA